MISMRLFAAVCRIIAVACCSFSASNCFASAPLPLSAEQQAWLSKAKRFERAGWIYLHVEGEPGARGFQHGYLLAKEIAEGLRLTRAGWEHQSAMDWPWLVQHSAALFVAKIDPENLAELDGIA